MRWMFASTPEELAHKREMLRRMDVFWQALTPRLGEIAASFLPGGPAFPNEWMHGLVNDVDERIMWEYGPPVASGGVARLALTPEVERHLRPMVSSLVARAPKVPGWTFHPYRPRGDVEAAEAYAVGRGGGSINGWRVKLGRKDARINLRFLAPDASEREGGHLLNCAFVATECLLGEQVLDQWVGEVDVEGLSVQSSGEVLAAPKHGYELSQLHSLVKSLIRAHLDQLPASPFHETVTEDTEAWMHEYPMPEAVNHDDPFPDVVMAFTHVEKLLPGVMLPNFSSGAHSKHGERIGVVKIRVDSGLSEDARQQKSELMTSLGSRLAQQSLGCVLGAMTGMEHSYLLVSLAKLAEGARATQAHLAAQRVPRESWLFFPDPELSGEWLGAYPDSPPPSWIST